MTPDVYQSSSVPFAMAAINMILLPDQYHPQEGLDTGHSVTIDDQALIRITRDSSQDDSYSPTPEGIHQDNTELSSVTLIGRYNVTQAQWAIRGSSELSFLNIALLKSFFRRSYDFS